jgi:streptogramin lyase
MDGQARRIAERPKDLRALKALVVILGVLIILGTALVAGVIIHRIYASQAAPSMTAAAPLVAAALPAGTHVAGIAAAGDEVAIWVTGAGGDRVFLLDPRSGRVTVALASAGK